MWHYIVLLGLTLYFQKLDGCGCGMAKRNTLVERSYLSPLVQSAYDAGGIRPNPFLATKQLPLQSYTTPLTPALSYNLASKSLQKQGSSSSYSLTETPAPATNFLKPTVDPVSKLADLLALRLTLKTQKDAIKIMEDQLALQIAEAARQYGIQEDPIRKPSPAVASDLYPPQNGLTFNYPTPSASPYPASINYGQRANELFQTSATKEVEGQQQESVTKNLMTPQMATAYSPYSGYSTTNSAASSSYSGGSSSASLGYQTALS